MAMEDVAALGTTVNRIQEGMAALRASSQQEQQVANSLDRSQGSGQQQAAAVAPAEKNDGANAQLGNPGPRGQFVDVRA